MVIYGEYLFLENFITGGLLLLLTGKLMGRKPSHLRLVIGAGLCGLAGFTAILPPAGIVGVAARLGIAAVTVLIGLGERTLKGMATAASIFLALTLISGGGVMALMLWQEVPAVSGGGGLYIPPITYLKLLCFGTLAFGFTYKIIGIIRKVRLNIGLCGTAEVKIDGETVCFSAMIDTGNFLREPITGKPVALIGRKAAGRLEQIKKEKIEEERIENEQGYGERYVAIPFCTVGNQRGILEGIRTDSIDFRGNRICNAVIGFYEGDFEDSEMILGREFFDRGLSDE